ncbi:2OG-Fe(II) oxygenase family protein [Acanthocheilonema viteae]
MVDWQLRLTPKQAVAKIIVAIVGLAIGAYGVATIYKPLQGFQDELDLRKSELLRYYKTKHDERIRQTFYKRRDAAPNFSEVLNLRCSLSTHGIICSKFEPIVAPSDVMLEKLGLRSVSEWTASTFTHRPGMVMLNNIFKPISHLQWIKRSLFVYAEPPAFTNVGLRVPNVRNVFKEYGKQLRWSTLGLHYDWATKIYPSEGEALPEELVSLSNILSKALGVGPMYADAAIINFYSSKSTLAPHIDRSERQLSSPLISLSFGQTAVYLAGGTDLNDPIDAFYIRSGDVLVVYGPQRLIYHAVPRILQDEKFADKNQPEEIVKYANANRINITLRQVDEHK